LKDRTSATRSSEDELAGIPVQRGRLIFLLTVAAVIALVLGFLIAPWVDDRWGRTTPQHQAQKQPAKAIPNQKASLNAASIDDLRKVAAQGDAAAEFALGAHYATGEDVAQDYGEAFQWFAKSAEQGNVAAQSALGAYYWVGRGVARDLEKAYFWSILARAGGDETSKYRVAVLTSRMTRPQILTQQQQAEIWLKQHQALGSTQAQ
jgi:TPR repeat protein